MVLDPGKKFIMLEGIAEVALILIVLVVLVGGSDSGGDGSCVIIVRLFVVSTVSTLKYNVTYLFCSTFRFPSLQVSLIPPL